jgi:antagonist of KipI
MSITIIKPGISTSIQDLGRWGFQQYGVPIGGVMDRDAAKTANRLCENDDDEAVLECALHGLEIQFKTTVCFALTGGGARATLNGVDVGYNRLIKVIAGSTLKLHPDAYGCRTYIAFAGGMNIKKELGSASTYVASALGGIDGRNIIAGDELKINKDNKNPHAAKDIVIDQNGFGVSKWKAQVDPLPHVNEVVEISSVPGPEWEMFDETSQVLFTNQTFTIGAQSNRMGYRMEGATLSLKEKTELVSTAVTRGIVQVTNQGHPIILMADAQTIGGYPRIARIASADLSKLAQCRPGMKLKLFFKI